MGHFKNFFRARRPSAGPLVSLGLFSLLIQSALAIAPTQPCEPPPQVFFQDRLSQLRNEAPGRPDPEPNRVGAQNAGRLPPTDPSALPPPPRNYPPTVAGSPQGAEGTAVRAPENPPAALPQTQPWLPVGPAYVAQPVFTPERRVRIQPCCQQVNTGLPNRSGYAPHSVSSTTDIYYTLSNSRLPLQSQSSPATHRGTVLPVGGYFYSRPSVLERVTVPSIELQSTNATTEERLAFEEHVQGRNSNETATFLNAGGLSQVYLLHAPIPEVVRRSMVTAAQHGTLEEAHRIRRSWAAATSLEVLKIRHSHPFPQPGESREAGAVRAADIFRRDVAIQQLAQALTARASLWGRPFIRVAPLRGTPEQWGRGVVTQEVVRGPSAWELQAAVDTIRYAEGLPAHSPSLVTPQELQAARALLRDAGLEVQEANHLLRALEQFYRDTHVDVDHFCQANGIARVSNTPRSGRGSNVGFDYNHGQNVIWDAQNRIFVMIDW